MNIHTESNPTSNWALIRRLLALSWRYRGGCLKVLALQAAILSFGLFGIGFTGIGVDEIQYFVHAAPHPPRLPFHLAFPAAWPPMKILAAIACAVLGLAILRAVLDFAYRVELNDLVQTRIVVQLRSDVYDKLSRLSFRFFDANASSSLINRCTGDVQLVRLFIENVVIQTLILIISLAAFLFYMLSLHPALTFACLATTPLLLLRSLAFSSRVAPAYIRNKSLVDGMIQRLAESIRGIQVIKAFSQEPAEMERFRAANRGVVEQKLHIFREISAFTATTVFLSNANLVILLGYGGCLVIQGQFPLGTGMIAFAGILQQFSGQVGNISNIANSMQESLTGARRVFEVLDAPLEIQTRPDPVRLARAKGEIRFEHAWFDHGREPVLRDIDFTVRPGQCVAIVGATGSGKSALMSLIPRFYDPTAGRVLMDGVDLRELDLNDLRKNVGLVFQESFLFSTTIAANIAFGHPEATREQVRRAAGIAAAAEFIERLPDGYDTVLGHSGIGLSGGQRQRLALARAILLDPALLLLDDPTASIDPGTEHEIIAAMDSAMAARTTFIVAHRLRMLRRAETIIVLDGGRVSQIGSHEDLMRNPGYYERAARLQEDEEKR